MLVEAGQSLAVVQVRTQLPLPSQVFPPLSLQVVPTAAGWSLHSPALHETVMQRVVDGVQSAVVVHCVGGGNSWQIPAVQMALWQSAFVPHISPSGQVGHLPPQSMSVSF